MSEAKKATPRPLPRPNIYTETRPFWDAAREGRLLLQYCVDTGRYQWLPRPVSVYTGSRRLEWREASGRGTLYSWTNTLAPWPGHEDRVPYLCGMVDLEEGVRIVTNLVNCKEKDLRAGMPMKLTWERLSDEFNFPVFEPA
jgi:uncharacterized OB-fold protein